MKKNDWILIGSVFAVALLFFALHSVMGREQSGRVVIRVDDKIYGTYDLSRDQTIRIDDSNTLAIKGGQAAMIDADCRDQLCVHQKSISRKNESIICLPNKVIVSIEQGEENDVDAVAQ